MIYNDLGIDKHGMHQIELTPVERDCVGAIERLGVGRESAISAADLACALFADDGGAGKRDVRTLVNHLIITHRLPIMSEAGRGGGYYFPGSPEETERFKQAFHSRAMTGLIKMSRGFKASFVDTMMQYTLGFDDPETMAVIGRHRVTRDEDPVPAWVHLVTRLLDKISGDPVRYAEEIRRLQAAYGDIFVPREKVARLKQKTAEFQKLLSEIA